uniref:TSC22 domain family protein 3 n=1 Tax=Equus asinus TaxID=9793 RepID=A0A9L0JEG6_EQUAS
MRREPRESRSRGAGRAEGGRAGSGSRERGRGLSVPDTLESLQTSPEGAHLPAAPDLAGQAAPEPEKMAKPETDCRSPVGLDCCNCCLDLAHRSGLQGDSGGDNNNPGSPTVSNFRQLQEKLIFENLNTDKLNSIMRQDSLEPVLRDPCYLINEGICNRNIDQTMLSILLFFHSPRARRAEPSPVQCASSRGRPARPVRPELPGSPAMNTEMYQTPMEVAVYQLHNFNISFFSSLLGGDVVSVKLDNSASGASVVAIDNKIEQAMDLVKNHLMYAVREEVEILKEQIRELVEKNSQLERENTLLKTLASPEQLEKFQSRLSPEEPAPETPQAPEAPGGSAV